MKNKIVSRKCVVTGKVRPTKELIRVVSTKDGEFFVDSDKPGRGTYISRDIKEVRQIKRRKVLNRAFKKDVPVQIYEELENVIKRER